MLFLSVFACTELRTVHTVYPASPDPVGEIRGEPRSAHPKFGPPGSLSVVSLAQFSASLYFPKRCALFSATAVPQLFAYQSLPHSFRRDGGCTPPRLVFMPPDRNLSVKSFGIKSFTDPHPLTLIESNPYKNSGGRGVLPKRMAACFSGRYRAKPKFPPPADLLGSAASRRRPTTGWRRAAGPQENRARRGSGWGCSARWR
jgi:hypothetical protein